MDGASRENFPKIPESSGKKVDRAIHGAAHRALMTAASIIWSFWANGQITGERRDYCYYTRPRTQSKPDYTLVSQSLSGLLLPVRLSELRCREGGGGARSLFKRSYAHHRMIRLLRFVAPSPPTLFPLARNIWISRKWISKRSSIFDPTIFSFFFLQMNLYPFESTRKNFRELSNLWREDFRFFPIVKDLCERKKNFNLEIVIIRLQGIRVVRVTSIWNDTSDF